MQNAIQTASPFSAQDVKRFRDHTSGCINVTHLNNAGAGLMPDLVTTSQLQYIQLEAGIGGYEAATLRADSINDFYTNAAQLLGTRPSNIAFTASATDAFTRALSSIPFERGDVILTDKDDFVSNQIQFLSLQKRLGIKIIHIHNAPTGGVDLDDLTEKLRKHSPRLLAITHIPTNSGLVQPVDEISKIYAAHRDNNAGDIWYILDACQSIGQTKLDVNTLQCDFLSATGRKFLRGPRGTGLLFVSDRVLQAGLEPMFIDMRGAEWIQTDGYRQQPDAKRFEDWEFAYSTVVGTSEAIKYFLKLDVSKVERYIRLLADHARKELLKIDGVSIYDRGATCAGLVTFHLKGSNAQYIQEYLQEKKINVVTSLKSYAVIDYSEKGVDWTIRVSPHYYNTYEELDMLVYEVKNLANQAKK